MKFLFQLLVSIGVVYAALLVLLYFYQPKLVFLPEVAGRELIASPAAIGLAHEEVWLRTSDGVTIHAWYVPGPKNGRTLLFFHGNAGNISHRLDSLEIFNELGLNVLMVEYRGYGQSDGRPSERGTRLDARAAWEYLVAKRGVAAENIVVFGRSLGGAVAAQLVRDRRPAGVVLESSFTSVPDIGTEIYPWLPVRYLSTIRYDSLAFIGEFEFPVLIVHGPKDDIIPFHHGRRLFEAAREPKQFLEIAGGHNGGYLLDREAYVAGIRRFLDSL